MSNIYYFHPAAAQTILAAARDGLSSVDLSLDLNLTTATWQIRDNTLILDENGPALALSDLESVAASGSRIFRYDGETLAPIEVRSGGYYKLVPTDSVPTLEIDGVKMHRSKDIDPLEDARLKTELVVRQGNIVLDTCGGLGYSALFAVKAGASRVVSTEKSREVIRIREQNPWLAPGARDWQTETALARINLENADINQRITTLEDNTFDAVIHDPPRFTSATGDLYGKVFYAGLFRVMRERGRLFHYTGSPKKITRQDRFIQNVMKRLEQAGFSKVSFNDRLQGIYGEKQRPLLP
ncbi:MAG: hypothetical protein MI802_09820 [Desulfobacterales bacterium]|nr:hypothetical protein [Desulfobacterales bacterium]